MPVHSMQTPQIDVGVSPEVLRQIAEAEAKVAGKESSPQSLKDIERQMVPFLSQCCSVYSVAADSVIGVSFHFSEQRCPVFGLRVQSFMQCPSCRVRLPEQPSRLLAMEMTSRVSILLPAASLSAWHWRPPRQQDMIFQDGLRTIVKHYALAESGIDAMVGMWRKAC